MVSQASGWATGPGIGRPASSKVRRVRRRGWAGMAVATTAPTSRSTAAASTAPTAPIEWPRIPTAPTSGRARRAATAAHVSAPNSPRLLTRRTFELAGLPIPGPVAQPLAWLTMHVYLRPRGHRPAGVNALRAIRRYPGPILVVHGTHDEVVPLRHAELLARSARARPGRPVELLVVPGGRHRWLYEEPIYRERIAAFLARYLGGPYPPDEAAARASAVGAVRPADTDGPLTALQPAAP